ncbi:MAG: enoyl-CoA hydratase/isomerase family protein [Planctomycetota bacterium]|nr:enoyl-CoA hydratase/isomerase family protein [Planctomycetota bacterium]MDA1025213.1 enoyl-CoA hydratase/isomerase family protein [Planctomycetota bacterium]
MTEAAANLPIDRTEDGIVVLRLIPNPAKPRGGVVVLDDWLLGAIDEGMTRIAEGDPPTGFVLASDSERVFVAGADLAEIDALDDDALMRYLEKGAAAYQRIAGLSCPTVAAINGAALGGGLEIAMHCDALVASVVPAEAKPWRIGLPEAGLGLCPGWGGTQMLPARIDPDLAIRATATGQTFKATEIPDGLVDQMVPARDLMSAAFGWIRDHRGAEEDRLAHASPRAINEMNRTAIAAGLESAAPALDESDAASAVLEAVAIGLADGWNAAIDAERRLLTGLRHTDAARSRLEAFLAKA